MGLAIDTGAMHPHCNLEEKERVIDVAFRAWKTFMTTANGKA
jgi:hypothetical protein